MARNISSAAQRTLACVAGYRLFQERGSREPVDRRSASFRGLGFFLGDGRLNYGTEKILEAYYSAAVVDHLTVGLDYQYIDNPAYNRDRGPVSVFGLRVHAEV